VTDGITMTKLLMIATATERRDRLLTDLQNGGFATVSTESGDRGVQYAREILPHGIICQVRLAESNGYKVLTSLRQTSATAVIPFIVWAEDLSRDQLRRAMALGANDFLVEPFSPEELIQAIGTQLQKQSDLKQWFIQPQSGAVLQVDSEGSMMFDCPSTPPLDEVFQYIESNYHRSITLGDVAKEVGYSPAYLTHLTRRQTGRTIQQWIIARRMAAARQLLLETDQIVEQIATQIGYQHSVHFFRQFRQLHGQTPQTWRVDHRVI
jgi:AraC-like DNA-binding protein/CheY-like chemotaxis protein